MATNFGSFSGDPKTRWLTENGSDRRMALLEAFWFDDPKGARWNVPLGYVVDGASIPRPLWSLIGSPYTGDYRRASIVHDLACDEAVGNTAKRRLADRMFFYACRAGGWTMMLGRAPNADESRFDELESLAGALDLEAAQFIKSADHLYRQGLGPMLMVEGLAHDWIGSLLDGLQPQFPDVGQSDYFRENYASEVELRHAHEAFELAKAVLLHKPDLYDETIEGASAMGNALDHLWEYCRRLL